MAAVEIHRHYHIDSSNSSGNKQKGASIGLLIFQTVLFVCWMTMIILTLIGVGPIVALGNKVVWIAIISYYANGFTNLGGAISAFSAYVGGKAHKDAHSGVDKIDEVADDVDDVKEAVEAHIDTK